jgi:hypothetical protein
MDEKVLQLLHKRLEELKQRFTEEIIDGKCIDFAVYRELSGVIRGLATAQYEVHDLLRKLKDNDED